MKARKITRDDYINAVKKADREIELEREPGFRRQTKVHKNRKKYDRKRDRSVETEIT